MERTLSVAKIGVNASLKYAGHKTLGKITGKNFDEFLTQQAQYITQELGQLKGSLMKAGQMLSMYGEYFFPPQANEFLKKLQTESPSIEWPVIKGYLESYISPELIDELEIDPKPIGSASMGQVHKATIKATGEKIALKIQYPNLEEAIDSDIKALKKLLNMASVLPKDIDLTSVFEDVKVMLRQELNYTLEAELTQKYRDLIKDDPRYIVPQVFKRYSTQRVLATEYLEGLKADHPMVQSLSQKRRDALAENFLDLYAKELFQWNLIQTDPHLGNYKIQIDSKGHDKIVLLDFGATKEYSNEFMSAYRKMIKGSIEQNESLFFEGAKGLGFIIESDPQEYIAAFKSFCYEIVEPFTVHDEVYSWKTNNLPSRVMNKAIQFKNFDLRSPPKDIIFLDRKTGGVFIFLSVLNATINARKILDPYLKKV
ncbi:MAG: ABC1 kinase family protein [Pseudobdellovibrio sp.]